jgi:glycosyltransferase involved in cell wall biosynthesis
VRSRNRGVFYATGTFVFFLDADNYIGPDCLKIHIETLVDNPKAMGCYGPIQDFDNETNEFLSLRSNISFSYNQLLHGPYIDAMALFRREELIDFGMFDIVMPTLGWEDYELWLRLGRSSKEICFIDTSPLSYYRKHGDNMSFKVKGEIYNQLISYLQTKYPIQLTFEDTEIIKSIRMPQTTFAHLFFANSVEGMSESQSYIATSLNHSPLEFPISKDTNVQKLRFDPLNDYVYIRLKKVGFFTEGVEKEIAFNLSSNAIWVEDGKYLFDTKDSQVYIDFTDYDISSVDKVKIWLEYLSVGAEAQQMAIEVYKSSLDSIKKRLKTHAEEDKKRIDQLTQLKQRNETTEHSSKLLTLESHHLRNHIHALLNETYYQKNLWKIKLKKLIRMIPIPIRKLVKAVIIKKRLPISL